MTRAASRAWILTASLLTGGCDDDDPGTAGLDGGGPRIDGGPRNDGGSDAARADAAEGGADSIGECRGDQLSFASAPSLGRSFAAAITGNLAQLAYVVPACGGTSSQSTYQAIAHVAIPTAGVPEAATLVVHGEEDACFRVVDPALVADGASVRLFYTSDGSTNEDGTRRYSYDLFARDLTTRAPPTQLTRSDAIEVGTVAARLSESGAAAWAMIGTDELPTTQPGFIALGMDQQPLRQLVVESEGQVPSKLALAPLGRGQLPAHGLLAWIGGGQAASVFLRRIAPDGAPMGAAQPLSDQLGPLSTVAAAGRTEGGALIYTEALNDVHQLRFVAVDASGGLSSPVRVTSGNEDVREAAIAAYTSGYVIAYRRSGTVNLPSPSVQLLFVDATGRIGGTRYVGEATSASGIDVLVAEDGRVMVFWSDVAAGIAGGSTETRIKAARLTCL